MNNHAIINLYKKMYTSKSGSLVVEEYSAETGRLKGTFNATCATSDNKTVTVTNETILVFL
jgi:hypothetical protein